MSCIASKNDQSYPDARSPKKSKSSGAIGTHRVFDYSWTTFDITCSNANHYQRRQKSFSGCHNSADRFDYRTAGIALAT